MPRVKGETSTSETGSSGLGKSAMESNPSILRKLTWHGHPDSAEDDLSDCTFSSGRRVS